MSSFNLGGVFTWSRGGNSLPANFISRGDRGWPQINGTTNILPDLISKEATQFKWPSPLPLPLYLPRRETELIAS